MHKNASTMVAYVHYSLAIMKVANLLSSYLVIGWARLSFVVAQENLFIFGSIII